ncbi:glycosyltransferase family 4 protein [Patescibacteria group bacterium]|nr:glycosyltransferase family 4 protein [Patescibacteria group bacterium]MBU4512384.1 glycosyltransferase family 4 protein [Patescibacteria group bacterium]MCG2692493.1 glycosyltransferase family 4 protein [Candidatus Parcubacteria bacterium]
MKKLKIALFCYTHDTVPPKTNIISAPLWLVYYLANSLTNKGHKVTLFAIPGSETKAKLVAKAMTNWPKNKYVRELKQRGMFGEYARRFVMNDQACLLDIFLNKNKFDILHANTELALPLAALSPELPILVTYHSPFDPHYNELFHYYKKNFSNIFINSLSKAHANQAPDISFDFIVHNGIDINQFTFNKNPKNFLLFCGRINFNKGADIAIQVAKKAQKPLKIIGQKFYSSPKTVKFWDTKIAPHLNKKIQYLGFTPYQKVKKHYQNAKALLFLNRWKEAFGLVMIEAMACGTPVIAIPRGAVPEVVKDGVTGFLVKNQREAVKAVKKIYSMPKEEYLAMRHACRQHVEENFTIEKMVDNYEKAYYKIVKDFKSPIKR